jgi:hypothetical protein
MINTQVKFPIFLLYFKSTAGLAHQSWGPKAALKPLSAFYRLFQNQVSDRYKYLNLDRNLLQDITEKSPLRTPNDNDPDKIKNL